MSIKCSCVDRSEQRTVRTQCPPLLTHLLSEDYSIGTYHGSSRDRFNGHIREDLQFNFIGQRRKVISDHFLLLLQRQFLVCNIEPLVDRST